MTPTETTTILRQFNAWRRGDEDIPQFDQRVIGEAIDAAVEMIDRLEAAEKERDALRVENEALRAEVIHIKEVKFPRKAQAVADGWRGKCERLEAKIAEMERQEPIGEIVAFGEFLHEPSWKRGKLPHLGTKLYTLPGAKGEEK